MPDVPDVTGPGGPTLEDVADVLARTNRGILALAREVQVVQHLILFGLGVVAALMFKIVRMGVK